VIDNVRLGALFGKPAGASASAPARAEELLEFVGMSSFRMSTARDLTLVRQKQVEVARALATSPQLLMLDELMAGLNLAEVAQAMDLVRRIRQRGVTVLMIEHVMKAVMGVCDRIVVLHHGEKIAEGTPQEIAANRTVIEVYLGE
jgi:branched-chain amino acid transport system ATP-binding protein